jgi:hypothetical protein
MVECSVCQRKELWSVEDLETGKVFAGCAEHLPELLGPTAHSVHRQRHWVRRFSYKEKRT